jgi:RimJ/RimL family protein N-acetyltransferase
MRAVEYLYRSMPAARQRRSARSGPFRRFRRLGPWRERFVLPNGREVLLRPIEPADARALREGFGVLSADEVRMRFLHPLKELPADLADQLTHVDPRHGMALVVGEPLPPGQALIGAVVRASIHAEDRSAEFAILVARPLAGLGLGSYLMRKLLDWARRRRLTRVWGDVLLENDVMLRIADRLGFRREHVAGESGTVRVVRGLGPRA